jgi:hypothetical protein
MLQAIEHPVREVRIEPQGLKGILGRPIIAKGIVIFAHGSGSGRLSPRNNHVVAALRQAGLATFLLDLLTPEEEHDRRNVFNIDLLASRLTLASEWIADRAETADLTPGYFGASTGAGAALTAASLPDSRIAAKRSPRRICERKTRRTGSSPGLLLPYLSARRRERVTKLPCQYRATTGAGPP